VSAVAALAALLAAWAVPGWCRDTTPAAARAGLEEARTGATAWAPDAFLVYVENDEDLDDRGAAPRWGYLYYSPALQKSRAYSLRDGAIAVAEDLEMSFAAPPLAGQWIDSDAALRAAEERVGRAFRHTHAGQLSRMLLSRGTFQADDPDATTWTVIYTSPHGASLFVVVDAAQGTVRRTWRG
jgi:hypothetical protein